MLAFIKCFFMVVGMFVTFGSLLIFFLLEEERRYMEKHTEE